MCALKLIFTLLKLLPACLYRDQCTPDLPLLDMIRVVVLKFGVHLMWFQFGVRWFDMDMYVYTEPLKM